MTRSLRKRAMQGIIALVAVGALLPAGAAATPSAVPGASGPPRGPREVTTTASAPSAASISSPASVTAAASTSLGPAGEAAQKPYMGWSSYSMQVYTGNPKWITADQLIAQSDAMHTKLQKAGYNYINVDSGWTDHVDATAGRPRARPCTRRG